MAHLDRTRGSMGNVGSQAWMRWQSWYPFGQTRQIGWARRQPDNNNTQISHTGVLVFSNVVAKRGPGVDIGCSGNSAHLNTRVGCVVTVSVLVSDDMVERLCVPSQR